MTQFGSFTEAIAILGVIYLSETNPMCKSALQAGMNALAEAQRGAIQDFELDLVKQALIELTPDMEIN